VEFVVITGMSGAGKSQAASILEDMGYYCVDNMPAELMPRFAEICMAAEGRYDKVALVSDIRGNVSFDGLFGAIYEIRALGCGVRILFMEASHATVVNRYKETRHKHPLDAGDGAVSEAVKRERKLLEPLRDKADVIIDTTGCSLSALRRKIKEHFSGEDGGEGIYVSVTAFGYKNGVPSDADIVLDMRFLPNPFYVDELKNLTGMDEKVDSYIFSFPKAESALRKIEELLKFLLPQYAEEGKRSLSVAFGCTGGRHRSVAVAKRTAEYLRSLGYQADCVYRELW
jgi:UPF0042 nucleotide-binding protein